MSEPIIGIDLGTTNSEVAIVEDGHVVLIEDAGKKILPSFVSLSEDGKLLVGEPAKNQYVAYPDKTIKSIKRKMGTNEKVYMAATPYSPQEVSAIILRRLKNIAETYIGKPIEKAVITVPAYFSDAQRQATREAGQIAGLDIVRMINEPTAAALSYEASHEGNRKVLVYDLGGGTFDVSVVNIESGVVEVVASHGNNKLGGDDFDDLIVSYILESLKDDSDVDLSDSKKAMARITRAAESAKIFLSDNPFTVIEEEFITEKNGTPVNLSIELSRDEYEAIISPHIDETLEAVHIALKDAGLTVSDIDEVILVGGSTLTPLVGRRLTETFHIQPRLDVNPNLCVAMGAAIQAAMIAGETVGSILVDVTPYTFGTSALGDLDGELYEHLFVPVIQKNTPIPASKSEVFFTAQDGQRSVDVRIYQGENPDALNNIEIGQFMVEGLGKVPAGNPIMMRLDLDLDGILHASAIEKRTGLEKTIRIDNAISRFEQDELDSAKERVSTLFGDMTTDNNSQSSGGNINQETVKAQAVIEKAERLLDIATEEDREEIVNLIEAITDAINSNDIISMQSEVDHLSDVIFYLES